MDKGAAAAGKRLRLGNIPSLHGISQIKKFVASQLQLPADSIVVRKGPKWNYAFLTFRPSPTNSSLNGELPTLEVLRERLNGAEYKKHGKVNVSIEEAKADPFVTAKSSENSKENIKSLADQVTPLWRIPYEEQLKMKHEKIVKLLQEQKHENINLFEEFQMDPIAASPLTYGYRNKCEFSIGLSLEGEKTVGFMLGAYREGVITVGEVTDILHTPDILKQIASHLQTFIRQSHLPLYDRTTKEGFWRLLLARVHDDNVMLVVQVTANYPEGNEQVNLLVKHFEESFPQNHQIKSFFVQETSAVHHGIDLKAPFKLLFGSTTIIQTLCGLKFQISPLSFFQVNQGATEILYNQIKEYVREGELTTTAAVGETTLLDLCCGTGTIGITLASHVNRVIGVELVKDAIDDAKVNATNNNINNIEFICARVEEAIDKVISSVPASHSIVAVLDPPRNGVHPSVIKAIRKCDRISRVVFVACNPSASMGNFVDLVRKESKALIGKPFSLQRGQVVDLFPHTEHCELILQFHRNKTAE